MKRRTGSWLAACGGALWSASYMWPLLNPFTLKMVLKDDWAQHALGWLFFRNETPGFPFGTLRNFLHPLGTTLGYMDAIPWLALSLRPLSAVLPVDFQYLGLWICLSSAALAFSAARVAALSTPYWEQQAMAGIFTAMAPTLIERVIHPALCGHVFIVLAIALHLAPTHAAGTTKQRLIAAFVLLAFASATHPYLALMVLAIVCALPWRFQRQHGPFVPIGIALAMLGSVAAVLAALGYIGGDTEPQAWGFGEYSANLNTFFNSMGHSRIFAGLPNMDLQYEGYCYLGAGCFLLGSLAGCLMLGRRSRARILSFPWRRWAWPLVAACACAVLALASPWYWGQTTLLRVRVFRHLDLLTQSFRSSGRFIWPLAYVINLALLTAVLRALRRRRWSASLVLVLALGIQAYDLDPVHAAHRFKPARPHEFSASAWSVAERDYKHLVLYPAEIYLACDGPRGYRTSEVTALAYLAYRHGWTFNSGYAARLRRATGAYCGELRQEIEHGKLSADTLYIVWRKDLQRLQRAGAVCSKLDHVNVCVLAGRSAFAMQLAQPAH